MLKRLRKFLTSVPSIAVVGLVSFYLVCGFLLLPAVVEWQLKKQVAALGHELQVADVRFYPLQLRLEIDQLSLADAQGARMAGFTQLVVDFEWRSIVDRAWTLSDAMLRAPVVRVELDKQGRSNFSDLIERLTGALGGQVEGTALPAVVLERVVVSNGRIEWCDRMLDPPLVTRIEPLAIEIDGLSSAPAARARYRMSARTDAGESLQLIGELGLDPVSANGRVALERLKVATVARAMSRQLALQSPGGALTLGALFEVAAGTGGEITGKIQEIEIGLSRLSLQPANAAAPLVAADMLALHGGRVDLAGHEVRFAALDLDNATLALVMDAQGRGNWSHIVRATPAAKQQSPAAGQGGAPTTPAINESATPWSLAIDKLGIADLSFVLNDVAQDRKLVWSSLQLEAAPSVRVSAAGTQLDLGTVKLGLDGLQLEDASSALMVPSAQLEFGAASMSVKGSAIDGRVDAPRLALAQGASARQGTDTTASIGALTLNGSSIIVAQGDDKGLSLRIAAPRVALPQGGRVQQAQNTAAIGNLALDGNGILLVNSGDGASLMVDAPKLRLKSVKAAAGPGRDAGFASLAVGGANLALVATAGGNTLAVDGLRAALDGMQLQDGNDRVSLAQAVLDNKSLAFDQSAEMLRLRIGMPALRLSQIDARRGDEQARLQALSLTGKQWQATKRSAGNSTKLALSGVALSGEQLAVQRPADGLELAQLTLDGEALQLALDDSSGAIISGDGAKLALRGVAARQGDRRVQLQNAAFEAQALRASSPPIDGGGTSAGLDGVSLTLASAGVALDAASGDAGQLASARLTVGRLTLALPDGPPDVQAEGADLQLQGLVLRDPADLAIELLALPGLSASGVDLKLREKSVVVDTLVVDQPRVATWLNADGRLNLLETVSALALASAPQATSGATPAPGVSQPAAPFMSWHLQVNSGELNQGAVRFEDRRRQPVFSVALDDLQLRAQSFDSAADAPPMQVELGANLASGGRVQGSGAVSAARGAADLRLDAKDVVLAPLQSYLSEFVELQLAYGKASFAGRLVLGDGAEGTTRVSYTGTAAVTQLLLEEIYPKRPFVAWDSVRSDDVTFTLGPDRLDIGELRVDKPVGRLIIAEDQTVNIGDVLKNRPQVDVVAANATQRADAPAAELFPVTVARVRVDDGLLEFADLSLRPQFGARMHQLKGVITGLGTDANRSAQVKLDARVNKFGSAKIRGHVSVLQPERLTDIEMEFRNLDMTTLSPYAVRFAGYEIAAGRMSLDLQYKIKDSKLVGENKVLLNKVELGKKVDSPGALDLPLELALSVLKDSNGLIDIGVPVSGNLDDPNFDYGAVIAKAIANLLGGIVTAPFRALAALFGGNDDKTIDTIVFDPGAHQLAPPEQQKLETVGKALKARPQLLLKVAPVYAPEQDTAALRSRIMRAEIAQRMGLDVEPGEDPGPIDVANPRVPAAVDAAFNARYAPAVLDMLKQRAMHDLPPQLATTSAPTMPDGSAVPQALEPIAGTKASNTNGVTDAAADAPPGTAAAAPQRLPVSFYEELISRMVREQVVSDEMLAQLAVRRADVITAELVQGDGVLAARVVRGETGKTNKASDREVPLMLQLEVAK